MSQDQLDQRIHDYIIAHPEVLVQALQSLDQRQREADSAEARKVLASRADDIFRDKQSPVGGNAQGDVTMVEFFDYNCPYCRQVAPIVEQAAADDPQLRIVYKEFPILGPDSQKASIVSMAFHKMMPQKYGEFHTALLGGEGRATEAKAIKIALSLGANEAKLREHMKDPDIPEAISKTYELATKLAISGTPSYVVGNEVIFGALGQDVLAEKIAAAKAQL